MSLIEFLSEFSFRRVVLGTMLIGLCSGAMGTFLYLRRQSMMSDVIGHSATPGVMGSFCCFLRFRCWRGRSCWRSGGLMRVRCR